MVAVGTAALGYSFAELAPQDIAAVAAGTAAFGYLLAGLDRVGTSSSLVALHVIALAACEGSYWFHGSAIHRLTSSRHVIMSTDIDSHYR